MQDWLSAQTQARPDAPALVIDGHAWSFRDLNDAVTTYAAALDGLGVARGDNVALLMPNSFATVCLIHAVMRVGAVLVPLNTRLTAPELDWQITHTHCKVVIYIDQAADEGPYTTANPEALMQPGRQVIGVSALLGWAKDITEKHRRGTVDLHAPFAIVFTSGTTGQPKGAVLTYDNFYQSAMASAYRLGVLPSDRWLCVLPLYHVGGLSIILRSVLYGTTVDLYAKFEVEAINEALSTQPITLVSLVPTMLYRLLDVKKQWGVRLVLLGGAAASPELLERARTAHVPVAITYGLSEAASQVATALPEEALAKPGTVGRPLLFTSVRIIGENGQPVPRGMVGEVVVSGPTVMQGYYEQPDATAQTIKNGELWTGDLGYLDADGDLWLVQRRSDLIVSGGENVYPAEVEAVLKKHPAVEDACVVGVPHPEWGQQVAAAIVLRKGHTISDATLLAYSRERLAGYKQPRVIRFVEALPQTASGKISRREVAALFAQLQPTR
ncbi:MAG: o-succinylbenzoate--CoA ligase [Anaerolineae bacterium]